MQHLPLCSVHLLIHDSTSAEHPTPPTPVECSLGSSTATCPPPCLIYSSPSVQLPKRVISVFLLLPPSSQNQVKEETRPQMVFTVRHATVTFQTDGDTWREQKEKKAALMVGILIGVFVLCWIPFFITELIVPLCSCDIPPIWKSVFLWLGYSNSFFNPLIYTAFNKNYNNALRNLFSRQR